MTSVDSKKVIEVGEVGEVVEVIEVIEVAKGAGGGNKDKGEAVARGKRNPPDPEAVKLCRGIMEKHGDAMRKCLSRAEFSELYRKVALESTLIPKEWQNTKSEGTVLFAIAHGLKLVRVQRGMLSWNPTRDNTGKKLGADKGSVLRAPPLPGTYQNGSSEIGYLESELRRMDGDRRRMEDDRYRIEGRLAFLKGGGSRS